MEGFVMPQEIRICENHDKQVPLISTMAFSGAEFWCPFCGYTGGIFGAGEKVPFTAELGLIRQEYEEKSKDYLRAIGRRVATKTLHNGEWIEPFLLPPDEKERDAAIIAGWNYEA
jgi:hypothetical protein